MDLNEKVNKKIVFDIKVMGDIELIHGLIVALYFNVIFINGEISYGEVINIFLIRLMTLNF